jgi:uncharacterized protein (DUF2141 family)
MLKIVKSALVVGLSFALTVAADAGATHPNDLSKCSDAAGPAALVTVKGLKAATGRVRVQAYRATGADWLAKGRWLARVEAPATGAVMKFCVPLDQSGSYGFAVRHDINGNGKTDFTRDGGGMSNNPAISVWNLGKPSVDKVTVRVGAGVTPVNIVMRYM